MPELLLELLSEEIPARMQARAAEDLRRLVTDKLKAAGLDFTNARAYATPRRLALVVEGLPDKQPDIAEEKKGPKVGAPEQALAGFMKANGLASIDEAEVRDSGKGGFYFLVKEIEGRPTADVCAEIGIDATTQMSWPKSMVWGETTFRWVRPLHSVLGVFDGEVLSGDFSIGVTIKKKSNDTDTTPSNIDRIDPIRVGYFNNTFGHRFLASGPIEISSFADYRDKLRDAKVMLDPAERRAVIAEQAASLAQSESLSLKDDPVLLDEVTGLVEWPVVLMGRIDDDFMALPHEVLSTAMRSHQKYFSTLDADGKLANRFIFVANMETPDGGKAIVAGNERVLRPRLADARFFWDQDRKASLGSRVPALEQIVFHAKLGTLAEKIDRVEALAVDLAKHIPGAEADPVRSGARLAKADLTTGMVGEFPELQGLMGRYYALHDGEQPEVAEAIAEHYSPLGPNDRCPSAPVSVAVALADKLDILVGFWAIDEKPTGSKDPYALRRAALGVIRLIVENKLRLPLSQVIQQAAEAYGAAGVSSDQAVVSAGLLDFFAERLKVVLRDQGVRHDLITAVFARGGEDDLVRLLARVEALKSFLDSDDGANLLVAYRRAANIVRIESKKDKTDFDKPVDDALLAQAEEKNLAAALASGRTAAGKSLAAEDFGAAMSALAGLRQPVDSFFDDVTVNADEPELRENRLRLLSAIGATLAEVADFSKIEG